MDRYEFDIKMEQIKKLMKKKDFATAVKIADGIDWKKVKENPLLIMAADVYEISGKYDEAREVLLLAYEKTGLGRQLAYRLCRLSVKRGDFKEAEEFYEEFTHNSPYDAGKYILQYEMAKGKGEPINVQIGILETFIGEDMDDRWAFELAKLYHKAHLADKCVELCDTIILWFADGKYVEKALELKQLYVPLSENQKLKYEAQKSNKERFVEPVVQETVKQVEEEQPSAKETEVALEETSTEALKAEETKEPESEILEQVHEMDIDVNDIHVKDFSVNNTYDTMNIQKELAKSMSTLFDNTIEVFKPVKSVPVEETPENDQIEGQMSLEEVLAMFESGEIQTREEKEDVVEEASEEILEETSEEEVMDDTLEEEPDEIEELSNIIAQQIKENIQEEIEEEIEKNLEEEQESIMYSLKEDSEEENLDEIDTEDDVELEEDVEEELEEIFDAEVEEEIEEISEAEIEEEIEELFEVEAEEEIEETSEAVAEEEIGEISEIEVAAEDTEEIHEAEDTEEVEEEPEALPVEETKEEIVEEKPTVSPVKQSEIAKHELKKFISKFTGIKGLDKQILKVMQNVLKVDTQPVKFVFVKGEVRSGKTTLAIEVIKVINRIIQRKNQKIAKIKGINLNDKSIDTLLETLKGSDVLIERVSDMDIEVFIEFVQKLREEGKPRVVIFEDEKTLAEAYLEELPEEYNSFTNVIDIKLKEIRDWASIAENYAKERGYTIDAMGTLALSAKIDQLKAITTVINNSHIEELIDEAIIDAEKFSVKRMFAKLFGKTDELTMLTEKNFTK
ncbi:MAG: tetratricopeptide repeat protein [Lachnospiraceae bacterium]|nr:tetratricopeptide repeat protein [Lachnospiraceae bacterium]